MKKPRGRMIGAIALLAGAFAALVSVIPEKGGMALDMAIANWLQQYGTDRGSIFFTWISWLGDTALSGLLVAAVLILTYRRRRAAAVTVVIAAIVGMQINIALKPLFHRGRPDFAIEFIAGPTWSFPSGHSMASIIGFGVAAYFRSEFERSARRRRLIGMLAGFIVISVGFSRLYLGVHYFSDVLGGFLAGAIWLLICIAGYQVFGQRPEHTSNN